MLFQVELISDPASMSQNKAQTTKEWTPCLHRYPGESFSAFLLRNEKASDDKKKYEAAQHQRVMVEATNEALKHAEKSSQSAELAVGAAMRAHAAATMVSQHLPTINSEFDAFAAHATVSAALTSVVVTTSAALMTMPAPMTNTPTKKDLRPGCTTPEKASVTTPVVAKKRKVD